MTNLVEEKLESYKNIEDTIIAVKQFEETMKTKDQCRNRTAGP